MATTNTQLIADQVKMVNTKVRDLVVACYETLDGVTTNIDPKTHKILLPVPWSATGSEVWNLRTWEANTLRVIMLGRAKMNGNLFDFNRMTRSWHINITDYNSVESAITTLEQRPIAVKEWLWTRRKCGEIAADRMRKHRSGRKNSANTPV